MERLVKMEQLFLRSLEIPLVRWLIFVFCWIWTPFVLLSRKNDPLPSDPNMVRYIFLISYAATSKRLTQMSLNTTLMAAELADRYPSAKIIGCEFYRNPSPAKEWKWKLGILPRERSFLASSDASSTTDERKFLIGEVLHLSSSDNIDNSIVVGNGPHLWRAADIWKYYHPDANLCFRSTTGLGDGDPMNPMIAQRSYPTWSLANVLGKLALKIHGVEYYDKKNLAQPTS